jgi:hypothetical protein
MSRREGQDAKTWPRYRLLRDRLRISEIAADRFKHYLLHHEQTGRQHRLYEKEYLVAMLFDGKRDVAKIAAMASDKSGLETLPVDVDSFAQQLLTLGFVELV